MKNTKSIPVLLLGAKHHGGLSIARSLGALGVPIYLVDTEVPEPILFSRYLRKRFVWNLKQSRPSDSVAFLRDVARRIGERAILIPTNDQAALFVADYSDQLQEAYLFSAQNAKRSRELITKKSLFDLATLHGIPTPHTFVPASMDEAVAYGERAKFPLMLKQDNCGIDVAFRGNRIAHRREELAQMCARLDWSNNPNLLLQEYIPGGDDSIWMFNGYFDQNSDCLFGLTGKKIRQCPIRTGASCLAICTHNATVHEMTLRFLKATGYQGIVDMGYRYDARDGLYKLLDVNPRVGSTFRLFVGHNGMDVARAQYLHLTGQPVPTSAIREGRKWIVEDWDLISSLRYLRSGELTPGQWIRSLAHIQEGAFCSLRDPLPLLAALFLDLKQLTSRLRTRRTAGAVASAPATSSAGAATPEIL